jgi:hypothetical protein
LGSCDINFKDIDPKFGEGIAQPFFNGFEWSGAQNLQKICGYLLNTKKIWKNRGFPVPTATSKTWISKGITLFASSSTGGSGMEKKDGLLRLLFQSSHKKIRFDNNLLPSPMQSQVARKKAQHFTVFKTIEDNSHLLDLLLIAVSPAQQAFFITALIKSLPDATPRSLKTFSPYLEPVR